MFHINCITKILLIPILNTEILVVFKIQQGTGDSIGAVLLKEKKLKRKGLRERDEAVKTRKDRVKRKQHQKEAPLRACSILPSDSLDPNLIFIILMFILLVTSLTSVTSACLVRNLSNYWSFSQIFKSIWQQDYVT